jgi:hypothetical protein
MRKAERQKEWENWIAQYRDSGESAKEWCAANNVKPNRLWYWLRKHKANKDAPLFKSNQWLPVEVREHAPTGQDNFLMIRVGEARIEVKPGFDPALLVQVVRALVTSC